jgi:hypothetical protein
MGFLDALKRFFLGDPSSSSASGTGGTEDDIDPLSDLSLDRLREGYMVDYEMRTWEVTQHARYDYDGWPADEWTLENSDDMLYLEHEYDDGDVFYLSDPVDLADVTTDDGPLREVLRDRSEPPAEVTYNGTTYTLDEEGPATRTIQGRSNELYYWMYVAGDDFIAFERYGESDWNAYAGREVEPFEFDNILPRAASEQ